MFVVKKSFCSLRKIKKRAQTSRPTVPCKSKKPAKNLQLLGVESGHASSLLRCTNHLSYHSLSVGMQPQLYLIRVDMENYPLSTPSWLP
jgi:hypothetical protein